MRSLYVFIVTVMLLAGCSGDAGNTSNTNGAGNANATNAAPAANSNSQAAGYPQETQDAFMDSCESAGSDEAFCTCVLEKLQAKYSLEEFTAIEKQIKSGETSKDFIEFSTKARAECEK